jgi:hypothetical protein
MQAPDRLFSFHFAAGGDAASQIASAAPDDGTISFLGAHARSRETR